MKPLLMLLALCCPPEREMWSSVYRRPRPYIIPVQRTRDAFRMTLQARQEFGKWPEWLARVYDDDGPYRVVAWGDWFVREGDRIDIYSDQQFREKFSGLEER